MRSGCAAAIASTRRTSRRRHGQRSSTTCEERAGALGVDRLIAATRTCHVDTWRRPGGEKRWSVPNGAGPRHSDADDSVTRKQVVDRVIELDDDDRLVLMLRYVDAMEVDEIAATLSHGRPRPPIRSWHARRSTARSHRHRWRARREHGIGSGVRRPCDRTGRRVRDRSRPTTARSTARRAPRGHACRRR